MGCSYRSLERSRRRAYISVPLPGSPQCPAAAVPGSFPSSSSACCTSISAARILPDLPVGAAGLFAGGTVLAASFVSMLLGLLARSRERGAWSDSISAAGLFAMGFFSSLFVFTLLRDVGLALARGCCCRRRDLPGCADRFRRAGRRARGVRHRCVGFLNARRRARVVNVDVPLRNLPQALHGFTIAQISDIHVGPTIKRGYVDAIVDAVNALKADMIAVTGDLVDGSVRDLARTPQPLREIEGAPRRVLRHRQSRVLLGRARVDRGVQAAGPARAEERARRASRMTVRALVVAGVTDYSAHHFNPAQRSDPAARSAGAPADAAAQHSAGASAALGASRRRGGLRPAALGAHARRAVLALEPVRAIPAALHRRAASAEPPVGLHQPRHGVLGAAETLRCTLGDHTTAARDCEIGHLKAAFGRVTGVPVHGSAVSTSVQCGPVKALIQTGYGDPGKVLELRDVPGQAPGLG